jgi:hypothetical protein
LASVPTAERLKSAQRHQVGKSLALAGLVAVVAILLMIVASRFVYDHTTGSERAAKRDARTAYGIALERGQYAAAYHQLCSTDRKGWPSAAFVRAVRSELASIGGLDHVTLLTSNLLYVPRHGHPVHR